MSNEMITLLGFMAFFFLVGWIVTIGFNNWRRHKLTKLQAELHAKLLDKCGTSQELLEYLKSEAGSHFLESATIEQGNPMGRVLGSVQAGLILFILGIGVMLIRAFLPAEAFWNAVQRAHSSEGFLVIGVLLLALGGGFLASAAASYQLSKTWGLFETESDRQR